MWKKAGPGRKRIYQTAEDLEAAVMDYFDTISYWKDATDDAGNPIMNNNGDNVQYLAYAVPPTHEGLALHLGVNRDTWTDYRNQDWATEICRYAELRIRGWRTEQISTRDRTTGLQFLLANDSGFTDKVQVEVNSASMAERKNILAKLAQMQEDFT